MSYNGYYALSPVIAFMCPKTMKPVTLSKDCLSCKHFNLDGHRRHGRIECNAEYKEEDKHE